MNSRNGGVGVVGAIGLGVLIMLVMLVMSGCNMAVGVWNTLNKNYQAVQGQKSLYSSALNTLPQAIEGSWTMSKQYMNHESKTFRDYAAARSGILGKIEAFEKMSKEPNKDSELVKAAQSIMGMMEDFKKQSGVAINVAIENNPQLRAVETTKDAMRLMESSINQIKTALDDWVVSIKFYNTYRGNALPSIVGSFMTKFPSEIQYYEGDIKKLDIKSLNPESNTSK